MKLDNLLSDYLDYLEIEKGRSIKTRENYERYLVRFLGWAKIDHPNQITDELIRKYRLWLNRLGTDNVSSSKAGEPLSKTTQNYYVIALRGFLKYMARREIETLPAERIELVKTAPRDIDFLESEEIERLMISPDLSNISGLRDRAILETLFSTGLRVSELTSLNRDSINTKVSNELSVRGKGGKIRVVFLSPTASRAIEIYLQRRTDIDEALFARAPRGKNPASTGASQGGPPTSSNLRLTPRSIQRIIKKHAAGAGIGKDIHPHTLRHSFATDLLRNGADIRSVQALLGHSNISTTQVYTHITDKQLREIHNTFHGRKRKD